MDLTRQRNQGENGLAVAVGDSTRQSDLAVEAADLIEQNHLVVEVEDSIEQNYQDFERWIALSRLQTKRHD